MGFILIFSMLIRFVSLVASLALLRKMRGWQLAFLTLTMGILFCRQMFTLLHVLSRHQSRNIHDFLALDIPGVVNIEIYGLGISLLFIIFLWPLLAEQEKARRAIRQSEAKNQALLNAIPDFLLQIDSQGTVVDIKAAHSFTPAIPDRKALGKKIDDIFPAKVASQFAVSLDMALQIGRVQIFEYQIEDHGRTRTYECRLVAGLGRDTLALLRDITERKRLEKEILEISNREQMRIGQDLHDGLCQHLAGVAFMSEALQQRLAGKSIEESAQLNEITGLLNQATKQARMLARGLYPLVLENIGLVPALEELALNVENMFHTTCVFQATAPASHSPKLHDRETAIHLYRIVQEAVNNAVRHGQAERVWIEIGEDHNQIALRIIDNGIGFGLDQAPKTGMGLRIMNYRAQMIGATLDIHSEKNSGTTVSCYL